MQNMSPSVRLMFQSYVRLALTGPMHAKLEAHFKGEPTDRALVHAAKGGPEGIVMMPLWLAMALFQPQLITALASKAPEGGLMVLMPETSTEVDRLKQALRGLTDVRAALLGQGLLEKTPLPFVSSASLLDALARIASPLIVEKLARAAGRFTFGTVLSVLTSMAESELRAALTRRARADAERDASGRAMQEGGVLAERLGTAAATAKDLLDFDQLRNQYPHLPLEAFGISAGELAELRARIILGAKS